MSTPIGWCRYHSGLYALWSRTLLRTASLPASHKQTFDVTWRAYDHWSTSACVTTTLCYWRQQADVIQSGEFLVLPKPSYGWQQSGRVFVQYQLPCKQNILKIKEIINFHGPVRRVKKFIYHFICVYRVLVLRKDNVILISRVMQGVWGLFFSVSSQSSSPFLHPLQAFCSNTARVARVRKKYDCFAIWSNTVMILDETQINPNVCGLLKVTYTVRKLWTTVNNMLCWGNCGQTKAVLQKISLFSSFPIK